MEYSDQSPDLPRMELDRDLPTLTIDQLLDIEGRLEDYKPLDQELAAYLYNDYLRQVAVIHELVQQVGGLNEVLEGVYAKVG